MTVVVHEALDVDIPRACQIDVAAYANNIASPFLFPGPFPPDSQQKRVNLLILDRQNDSTIRYMKAVDEGSGEQAAFAKFHIYDTPEAATKAKRALTFGPGANEAACLAFFGGLAKKKQELMQNVPHICKFVPLCRLSKPDLPPTRPDGVLYLHLLHTEPSMQGRGAGSMLLRWGIERSKELNIPIYLESSPEAYGFYQKHGFEQVEIFSLNMSQYGGGDQPYTTPLMIRYE